MLFFLARMEWYCVKCFSSSGGSDRGTVDLCDLSNMFWRYCVRFFFCLGSIIVVFFAENVRKID